MTDPPVHLTDHWPVAPGHELSPEDWAAVKAYADAWAGRTLEAQASPAITPVTSVRYPGDGGRKDSGKRRRTQLWVVHTAECPLQTGYAVSLCRWAANGPVQASWHDMSDPGTLCAFVPDDRAAWHATIANAISVGVEQAGYAAFSRSTWLTQEGLNTIDGAARAFVRAGIPPRAVRRLSSSEVRRALNGDTTVEGLAGHYQIQPENRTDPGDGYPWDVLIARIRHHHPLIASKEDDMPNPEDLWDYPVPLGYGEEGSSRASASLSAARHHATQAHLAVDRLDAKLDVKLAGLTAAVEALADANGVDSSEIISVIEAKAAEAADRVAAEVKARLAKIRVTDDGEVPA